MKLYCNGVFKNAEKKDIRDAFDNAQWKGDYERTNDVVEAAEKMLDEMKEEILKDIKLNPEKNPVFKCELIIKDLESIEYGTKRTVGFKYMIE